MPDDPAFRVELKSLSSRHLPGPDEKPDDPADCRIEVTVGIGEPGDDARDDFDLWFVTPTWLARHADEPLVPEYYVVINTFTWAAVEAALSGLLEAVPAADWDEFTQEFGRYAHWEFSERRPRF